jgi:rRNA-processing protein FCF1
VVEFSRFPASLAIASEVYANLEKAVRAADEADRGAIFDQYNMQMERLDESTKRQLDALRK